MRKHLFSFLLVAVFAAGSVALVGCDEEPEDEGQATQQDEAEQDDSQDDQEADGDDAQQDDEEAAEDDAPAQQDGEEVATRGLAADDDEDTDDDRVVDDEVSEEVVSAMLSLFSPIGEAMEVVCNCMAEFGQVETAEQCLEQEDLDTLDEDIAETRQCMVDHLAATGEQLPAELADTTDCFEESVEEVRQCNREHLEAGSDCEEQMGAMEQWGECVDGVEQQFEQCGDEADEILEDWDALDDEEDPFEACATGFLAQEF